MNILRFCLCTLLLLYPAIGYPEQGVSSKSALTDVNRKTTILLSGDVLVMSESAKDKPVASYISTRPAVKEIISERIIEILTKTKANKSFLEFVQSSLPDNRVLKKDNFTLPLFDVDGTEYRFTYSSDVEYSLYSLNYQLIPVQKY